MPTANNPITVNGVTYDYAANSLNSLPTSELTRLQSSWWNAAIIGVEVALAIVTYGTTTAASSAIAPAEAALKSAQKSLAGWVREMTAETARWLKSPFWYGGLEQAVSESTLPLIIAKVGEVSAKVGMREAALAAAMSHYTNCLIASGVVAGSIPGVNALSYVANTVGNKARRQPTWTFAGQWLLTECKHTIYHMYVSDVADQETITLYNDIGSAYNYKTVAIGSEAFHNKKNLKTVKFEDVNTGEMYAPMTITIPDEAFKGCTNLETLDLIMYSNYADRDVALGPENFILCGEDIFKDCDMSKLKIRIGREKYEEFAENPVWGKYKANFKVVDVPVVVDFTDNGAKYSYSFENNSMKKQSYIGSHKIEHVHIVGQAEDLQDLQDQQGEVPLFNDAGAYNNYKLDYVKKKAFYKSQELKGISMFDLRGAAGFGDSYTELELVLQDSAFADCPNLEYINMLYFRTDGGNSVEAMSPNRVQLGKDVFKDSPKFRVKMVTTAVDEFKADTSWVKYEDRFLPCFILTEDPALKEALEACSLKYYSPVWKETFDIYDVTKVTDHATLNGKFQGKAIASFRDFKAFECIGLESVADELFKGCTALQSIELPSTIKTIGEQAFYGCALLDDVVIPAGVTSIGKEAFAGCSQLNSITFLSETPATLGENVFANMPTDYVIYVPEAAVGAYKSAWSQYEMDYEEHIQTVNSKPTGIFEVTLTEAGTLAQALGLTITDTDPLTISGNYSKYDSLKVVGPINGTDVGVIRFLGGRDVDNCEMVYAGNLKYLDLYDADIKAGGEEYNQDGDNDYITEDNSIDTYMFWELDKLQTLILPKSATKIKDNAFNNCDALRRLVIGDNTKSIGEEVTHDSPQLQEVILLCNEVPATDSDAWSEDKTIKVFYVPNALRAHLSGSYVYYTRGDSIASTFEDDAVLYALAEKRIYTTNDVAGMTSMENVLNGNTQVKVFNELMLAVDVTELGNNSLGGCSSLEEVGLPYNLESILVDAFKGCTSLMTVYVPCETPPTLAADAFKDLPEEFVICVSAGKEEDYRKAWPQYADHIQGFRQKGDEIKVVTVTEAGTLGEALGFSVSMDKPSDVGRISGDLISIKALKVIGPINGKDIAVLRMLGGREEEDGDEVALARMTYLDLYEATICTDENKICFNRDGVNDYVEHDNEIPEHMFWQLDKLQTVILPKNATKIDDNAFYDNIGIETIVVGDATVKVGNDAFGKCKNLKNIVFLGNEKATLDGDAFTDPISDQPYQVEKMFVPFSLYSDYVLDEEYTTHAKEICTNYMDDALFRAYGSHAVMNDDQLQEVTDVDGWFDIHTDVKDLTSLEKTAIETLKTTTLSALEGLQKITLPATLTKVENGAFAANTKLQWADFAQCIGEGVLTESNIGQLGFNPYALIYVPESFTATGLTNVVYGSEGDLKCDQLIISDKADYAVPREFKASAIRYDRQFVKGERTTLCLPFDMEVPAGATAYTLRRKENETLFFYSIEGGLEAHMPYVIVTDKDVVFETAVETMVPATPDRLPLVTVDNYSMAGTFTSISEEDAANQHMYALGEDGYWTKGKAVSPYSAYLQATTANMPDILGMRAIVNKIVIVDGECTEFENLWEHTVIELTYTRTLNKAWNALYVPFQIELTEEFLANYDVAYINDVRSYDWNEDGELDDWDVEIIKLKKLGKLKAHHPYVIRPKNDEAMNLNITLQDVMLYSTAAQNHHTITCASAYKQYAIKGVYNKTISADLDNGNYVYAVNKSGEWQKMGLETSLVPFRLYLTMANKDGSPIDANEFTAQSMRMRLVGEIDENGATVIYDVEMDEEQGSDHIYDLQGRRILEPKKGNLYIINNKKVIY